MNARDHRLLVRLAVASLRGDTRGAWWPHAADVIATCLFPDQYALALARGKTGPWRRYFPPVRRSRPGAGLAPACIYRQYLPPLRFFVRQVIQRLRAGDRREAARLAGVFSHYLADFAQPAHYHEADVGFLLPPPRRLRNFNIHPTVEGIASNLRRLRHVPRLLGVTEAEFLFHLEGRLAGLYASTVAVLLPMLRAIHAGNPARAQAAFNPVMAAAAAVFADFLQTAYAIARHQFDARDARRLARCDLRAVPPFDYDVEDNFGRRPLVDAITLPGTRRARPLALGGRGLVAGIGVVPRAFPQPGKTLSARLEYRLPSATYREFRATVGLLAGAAPQARCRFAVVGDGQTLFRTRLLGAGATAVDVRVDIARCRRLELWVHTDGSTDKLAYAIWGQPRLLKAPPPCCSPRKE